MFSMDNQDSLIKGLRRAHKGLRQHQSEPGSTIEMTFLHPRAGAGRD